MDDKVSDSIFDLYQSESPIATELRRLYHNIMNRGEDNRTKSFLITSSERGEGKSTITSHLALTIAQFPKNKVLVVDADLRRPKMHDIFGVDNYVGLMECLDESRDPMSAVKDTRLSNLKIVTSGGHSESPAQLFESDALTEFFSKVKFYFDYVLVDSAPVLAVSDILFLCSKVDSILFVLMAGVTPRQVVQRAKNILMDAKADIAGVVINNASEVLPYYYDYKYYGYHQDRS
jgi:capsular exopolysaccharide synthesis family protein